MHGRIVIHPRYGRGTVQSTRYRGLELQVSFEDGLIRWVRTEEIELLNSPTAESTSTISSVSSPICTSHLPVSSVSSSSVFKSRRMLEAFRLGVVPYECIEEFTFGRDVETNQFIEWANNPQQNVMIIVGEYGTGKSHFQHYIYRWALHNGFAVASVEMDPNESPFHKPKRVYGWFVRNFCYRFTESGKIKRFREFLAEAFAQGILRDHYYFKHMIDQQWNDILWDWIEAKEAKARPGEDAFFDHSRLPAMYDYSSTANIYCYLLSGLGWAAQRMGLKGLLLLFDEAETVSMTSYPYQEERSLNFRVCPIRSIVKRV